MVSRDAQLTCESICSRSHKAERGVGRVSKDKAMKVTNINGTADNICHCGSWLEHWKNFSGQALSNHCAEIYCMNKPEVGAHVQKDDPTDKNWYIVPFCKGHNGETEKALTISDTVKLVSANVCETCE